MPHLSQKFVFRFEAELAVEFLAEHEIAAYVSASDAGGSIPALQTTDGVRLHVADRDIVRAEELIRAWRSDDGSTPAPLSAREKAQSWLMGGAVLLTLVWILGSIFWSAEYRLERADKMELPIQARNPW